MPPAAIGGEKGATLVLDQVMEPPGSKQIVFVLDVRGIQSGPLAPAT